MRPIQFIIATLLLSLTLACNTTSKKENTKHKEHSGTELAHWGYEGEEGPEEWDKLCPAYSDCRGHHQSPIDISSDLSTTSNIEIHQNYSYVSGVDFVNNGHSIQVNFNKGQENKINIEGKDFVLKQFHFHFPSEHTIDGKELAGEAHFVHVSEDGHISVLGVFIEEGEPNEFIEKLTHHIPTEVGKKTIVTESICAQSAFSEHDEFYIYEGSLTTPPCTEGVHWFVRKTHIQATHEQLEALHKVMPKHNNRPVQPINDRKIGELADL